jgi:hypothetical protein
VTVKASLRGKISVLTEKGITLSLGSTNLFDSYLTVVSLHALRPPLVRCCADVVITDPARVEEVFSAAPGVMEELLGQRPHFMANLTLPPRQIRFARVKLCPSSPKRLMPGLPLFGAAGSLGGTLFSSVRVELHALALGRL